MYLYRRSTIQDLRHTRDNVTTSQSKTVRFDISSSTSPVDNLPTDVVSVQEQTKAPQLNTITNSINVAVSMESFTLHATLYHFKCIS